MNSFPAPIRQPPPSTTLQAKFRQPSYIFNFSTTNPLHHPSIRFFDCFTLQTPIPSPSPKNSFFPFEKVSKLCCLHIINTFLFLTMRLNLRVLHITTKMDKSFLTLYNAVTSLKCQFNFH